MNTQYKIYGLCNPKTNELKYIGFTAKSLAKRLSEHLTPTKLIKNNHKNNWIKYLLNNNLKPEIFILQETNEQEWQFDEQWNIAYFKSIGCKLTNGTAGGEGYINPSQESRNKLSQSLKIYLNKPEVKAKRRENNLGEKNPNYGKKMTMDEKIKKSESMMGTNNHFFGKHHTIENKEKASKRNMGKIMPIETRIKISNSTKGRTVSSEIIEKRLDAIKNRNLEIDNNVRNLYNSGMKINKISQQLKIDRHRVSWIINNNKLKYLMVK